MKRWLVFWPCLMATAAALLVACRASALPSARVGTAAPVAANSPTFIAVPSATGQPVPAAMTTPAAAWPVELLFQAGDLPEGVQAGQIDTAIPENMRDKYTPPDAAAGLTFEQQGVQTICGQVQVFVYNDAARLQTAYRQLVSAVGMATGP